MESKTLILNSYVNDLAAAFVQSLIEKVNSGGRQHVDVSSLKFRVFDDPSMLKQKRVGIYGWVESPVDIDSLVGASIDGCKNDIEPWGLPELIALSHYYIILWKHNPKLILLSESEKAAIYSSINKSCI